jgi:hypothetical protein
MMSPATLVRLLAAGVIRLMSRCRYSQSLELAWELKVMMTLFLNFCGAGVPMAARHLRLDTSLMPHKCGFGHTVLACRWRF